MHVWSYLRSLRTPYPLSLSPLNRSRSIKWGAKWATILSVAGALSMQPPQGFSQAGVSASAAVAGPSLGSGAKVAPMRHTRQMFGARPAGKAGKAGASADDPLAEIKAAVMVPPQDLAVAPFVGNATVILASTANGLVVARQPNCSLSAGNVPYSYDLSDPYGMPVSVTTSIDQLLHSEAGLTTTGGNFGGKCPDPAIGVNSNDLLYAGTSTGGMHMAAVTNFNGTVGTNVLYTFIIQANGSFGSSVQQSLPAANAPFGVVAGDLNGDGNPDIIAVGFSGTTTQTAALTVLLGNADGTFTVGQTYMLGAGPTDSAVIDDFNGDGKLDVVVAVDGYGTGTNSSGVLTFFPGKGDGTFGTPKTLALTTRAENLVSGDFNGDGKKDVASGTGSMFLGHGDGTFQPGSTPIFSSAQVGSSPGELQVAAGDFNKDGKLDLAASNGNQVFIVLGKGDGTFTSGNVYAGIGNHGYITATDLDGDGNLDLYSGDAHAGVFTGDDVTAYEGYALMGRGDGTFVGAPQFTAGSFNGMENLNGDQNLDFIAVSGNSLTVNAPVFTTYYGNGDGTFLAAGTPLAASTFTYKNTQYTVNGVDYVTADLNGDGKEDIFYLPSLAAYTGPTLRSGFLTALGTGNGGFQTPTYTPVPSLVAGGVTDYPVLLGDVQGTTNQHGKFEVVYDYVTSYLPGNNTVMYTAGYATQVSNGDGTFAAPAVTVVSSGTQQPQEAPYVVSLADLNGDKIPDLITYTHLTSTTPATLQVMLGNADGTFGTAVNLPVVSDPTSSTDANGAPSFAVAVGDVNGDGIPDVVAEGQTSSGGSTSYQLGVALGKGDGTFTAKAPITLANASGEEQIALGGFTSDGKVDLAIIGGTNGIFPGNGDGTFQNLPGPNSGTVLPALAIELGTSQGPLAGYDLNGSGKTDLVAGDTFFLQTTAVTPPDTSATALAASVSSISTGQSLTLTATVTASSGSGTPTGTVTFLDGTTSLGTATLNASGVATLSTTTLAAGVHSITATYGGDTNFSGSTSAAVTVTVTAGVPTTTKLSSSAASAASGTSLTFSAVVSAASGSATPTGTVTFLDGTTTLGTGMLDGTGTATYTTSALAVGAHSITAAYAGAAGVAASTSSAVSVTVTAVAAGFSLGLSPATGTVSSGSTATTTITVTAAGGFNQAVSLVCSGAPQNATCSISPASLTPNGSAAATATMTINAASALNRPWNPGSQGGTTALAFLGGGAFLSFALLRRRHGKLWLMQLGCVLVLVGATVFTGCGGGSGGSGGNSGAGTYTLTVTGTSGSLTKTATYSLTVQ